MRLQVNCLANLTVLMNAKKKSHAGRKPAGPLANNTSQLTIRMPDDLRAELEESANKRGWSLTQELLWRVRSSYTRQRGEARRSPATRAICFLIANVADRLSLDRPETSAWYHDPFMYRAFRLAVGHILQALEPPGEIKNPYEGRVRIRTGAQAPPPETPEEVARDTAAGLLYQAYHPSNMQAVFRDAKSSPDARVRQAAELLLDNAYGFEDVQRDLVLIPGPEENNPSEAIT
jgi:hypothetical protein